MPIIKRKTTNAERCRKYRILLKEYQIAHEIIPPKPPSGWLAWRTKIGKLESRRRSQYFHEDVILERLDD